METEGDAGFAALSLHIQHPIKVQRPGVFARFSAYRYFLYPLRVKITAEIYLFQHRSDYHQAVFYGQRKKYRHTGIGIILTFYRTADSDMVIAFTPICGQAHRKPFYPFRKEKEGTITTLTNDFPNLFAPFIRLFNEQIRSKAQGELGAGRIFPIFLPVTLEGKTERGSPAHLTGRNGRTECDILTIYVTMLASCTYLMATMPGVPHRHNFILSSNPEIPKNENAPAKSK